MGDRELLACMRTVEEDLDSTDPASNRRAWRKLGTHLIAVHKQTDQTVVSITELHKAIDGITQAITEFRVAVFDPHDGIIVNQQRQIERMRWTVVVLSAIAAVITFALGLATGLIHIWGPK